MKINLAKQEDLKTILEIVNDARSLIENLNFKQWTKESNYPSHQDFYNDYLNNVLYVIKKDDKVIGMMSLIAGLEPTYQEIQGAWLNQNNNYLTIHRLAVSKEYYGCGVAKKLIDFAKQKARENNLSLRVDTHPKNLPMNKLLIKENFKYCGIIYLKKEKVEPERNAYEFL